MRSSGGTNFGLAWSVVTRTKSTMACFAGPSFHEGSGSGCITLDLLSAESAGMTAHINAAMAANNDKALVIRLCFICLAGGVLFSDGECCCERLLGKTD